MMEKLTGFVDFFRKIQTSFLAAIVIALGLILFLPDSYAKIVAVNSFKEQYHVYLGPFFILTLIFLIVRICMFFIQSYNKRKALIAQQESLHNLTPEEKGYLVPFIIGQENTIQVGADDGIMGGLVAKSITYRSANLGSLLYGFAFNLQPWAREYLENNKHLLDGHVGQPMTPSQKLDLRW